MDSGLLSAGGYCTQSFLHPYFTGSSFTEEAYLSSADNLVPCLFFISLSREVIVVFPAGFRVTSCWGALHSVFVPFPSELSIMFVHLSTPPIGAAFYISSNCGHLTILLVFVHLLEHCCFYKSSFL